MTSTRVIRGTKAKIFLYVCAILVITGLIACYNNTLYQLDDIKKTSDVCRQHEENLSTQLQVISDYKQRLEKSLKTEKAEHQQTKTELESKLKEEKTTNEKLTSDSLLKYNSLQQHFNLLQTQYDDFKEDCSKTQQKQLEEINDLQSKLSELQEELKTVQKSKENLKTENMELRSERDELKTQLSRKGDVHEAEKTVNEMSKNYHDLRDEFESYKSKCKLDTSGSAISKNISSSNFPNAGPPDTQLENENQLGDQLFNKESSSTSSTVKSILKPSAQSGGLIGALPLLQPGGITPETAVKKVASPLIEEASKKENQPEIMNNRYQSQINEKAKEDVDKENGAHEVFDHPNGNNPLDELGFGENDVKQVDKPVFDKKHIDAMGAGAGKDKKHYDQDYKDQHEVQLEQEGDDDVDADYVDQEARQQEPAVRN